MSGLDVEALLDAAANRSQPEGQNGAGDSPNNHNSSNVKDHDSDDRRSKHEDRPMKHEDVSPRDSAERDLDRQYDQRRGRRWGSNGPPRRSRSRDNGRPRRSRDGDYYRGGRGGRSRSRSRSPYGRYRPRDGRDGRDRRDRRDRDDRRDRGPRDAPRQSPRADEPPQLTEDERDKRTVFVQQLAARLRSRQLKEFFEKVGPVTEAQIVKDRISQRSKGVGYVEFKDEESVTKALQLTGQKLLGIPVIVQVTEAEKNRQARTTESGGHPNSIPFHRLYVGNIHFNVTEQDLQAVFEPFGELEFVQLQKDDGGRSRGYGFVQFRDAHQAREALEKMNGFDLAGRPIRVGLGNDKFSPESTANLLQKFPGRDNDGPTRGSSFSGYGGRGHGGSDRSGGRDNEKVGGASALDDTDVGGVNFNTVSRNMLMSKLARTDDSNGDKSQSLKPKTEVKQLPVNVNTASRCIVLHNMFDPAEEEAENENWVKELEDDVRQEADNKYGHVVHIAVDANSKGDIYLKFDKVQGGENAIKGLNGRYFGGRMIDASPVVDAVYSSLFSRSRAF